MPKPYSKRARTASSSTGPSSTSSSTTLTITLKPLRASATGPNVVTVSDQTPDSSIYDVKAACAKQAGYATDKVKILWERKPVGDSKTVKEVVGEDAKAGSEVEMGVMFMGQPTLAPGGGNKEVSAAEQTEETTGKAKDAPVPQGDHGEAVLETEEFWNDLNGFLLQRLRDEAVTGKVTKQFRDSWRASKS
jgi:hypothetical protein